MSGNDGLWSDVKCDAVEPTPSVLCELLVPAPIHNLTKGFFHSVKGFLNNNNKNKSFYSHFSYKHMIFIKIIFEMNGG
jgi:hypothetical protein